MTSPFRSALLAASLAAIAAPAIAQAPAAPAAAPAAPAVTIPSHNCVAPEYPGKNAGNDKIKAFNTGYTAYGECIKKYIESVRSIRDSAMAKGNDAVNEYNKFTEEVKNKMDAEK
jgi:hypothetical protein